MTKAMIKILKNYIDHGATNSGFMVRPEDGKLFASNGCSGVWFTDISEEDDKQIRELMANGELSKMPVAKTDWMLKEANVEESERTFHVTMDGMQQLIRTIKRQHNLSPQARITHALRVTRLSQRNTMMLHCGAFTCNPELLFDVARCLGGKEVTVKFPTTLKKPAWIRGKYGWGLVLGMYAQGTDDMHEMSECLIAM